MARSEFWAITSYYAFDDPENEKRRRRTYNEFRRHLQLPLAVVELAADGPFDLSLADAELLIQVRGGAFLWQKERLLNIALEALPGDCDAVAWIDCDVVLMAEDWVDEARRALDECALVQPFERVYYLDRDVEPCPQLRDAGLPWEASAASLLVRGDIDDDIFRARGAGMRLGFSPGIAWAAKRDLLREHGFYDAMILGAGDKAMFCSACGRHEDFAESYRMTPRQKVHYDSWASRFFESVKGRIGYVKGDAFHLWHGDRTLRYYSDRYTGFVECDFDPYTDIIRKGDGIWHWNSDKPELHDLVRLYFERRKGASRDSVTTLDQSARSRAGEKYTRQA